MRGLLAAVSLLTVVPSGNRVRGEDTASAVPWLPVVGAGIGLVIALVYVVLHRVLPPLLAAALAVAAGIVLTGALHEDGLADSADGLGSRGDREELIRVMREPTLGSFGVLALVLGVVVRIFAVSALPPDTALFLLPLVHLAARAGMAGLLVLLPVATEGGLAAAHAGKARPGHGILALLLALGSGAALFSWSGLVVAGTALLGALSPGPVARRRLGGVSGDLLGAGEQVGETLALVVAAGLSATGIL